MQHDPSSFFTSVFSSVVYNLAGYTTRRPLNVRHDIFPVLHAAGMEILVACVIEELRCTRGKFPGLGVIRVRRLAGASQGSVFQTHGRQCLGLLELTQDCARGEVSGIS